MISSEKSATFRDHAVGSGRLDVGQEPADLAIKALGFGRERIGQRLDVDRGAAGVVGGAGVIRAGSTLTIEGTSDKGIKVVETFSLAGATAASKAIDGEC